MEIRGYMDTFVNNNNFLTESLESPNGKTAIFSWLVEGAYRYYNESPKIPDVVADTTKI